MKYLQPIDGLRELMMRSLLVQILADVGKMFGHSQEVFMRIKDDEPLKLVRSKDRNIEDDRLRRLSSSGEKLPTYLHLTSVSMATVEDEVYEPSLSRKQTPPIIQDGTYTVTPSYRRTEIKMTIKYWNDDKINLQRRVDQILLNLNATQGKYVHDVDIRYPLGARLSALTLEIFKKRISLLTEEEQKAINFLDYLKTVCSRRVRPYVNETTGEGGASINIVEKQRTIIGLLETNLDTVEVEYDENNYGIEFEYSFTIEHPFGFIVDQPIMINNNMIDKAFIQTVKKPSKPDHDISTFYFTNLSQAVMQPSKILYPTTMCYYIPEIDQRVNIPKNGRYDKLFVRLVQVKDGTFAFNLKKISGKQTPAFELKKEILDWILKEEREYITKYGRSIFYLGLMEDGNISFTETLTITEEGIVFPVKPCDVKVTYRVVLFINLDFSLLPEVDKRRISKYMRIQEVKMDIPTKSHYEALCNSVANPYIPYQPYEIRSKYLSTLNLLLLSYGISADDIERLKRMSSSREDYIFLLANPKYNSGKSVQIFHTDILKEVKGEEDGTR